MSELATAIVITDHDPREAVSTVASATGHAEWLLQPVRPDELAGPPQVTLTAGPAADCPARATAADVRGLTEHGESFLFEGRWADARTTLSTAERALSCIGEPVEVALVARLYLVLGTARFETDDVVGASRAFATARAVAPDLAWDPDLPGAAQEPFTLVTAASPHDGGRFQPVSAPDDLRHLDDPTQRASLLASAARAFPGRAVFVYDGKDAVDASHTWTTLPPVPPLSASLARPARPQRRYGESIVLGGMLVAAVGAGTAGYGFFTVQSKVVPPEGETPAEMLRRFDEGGRAGGTTTIGLAILAEGVAIMAIGVPWSLYDARTRR